MHSPWLTAKEEIDTPFTKATQHQQSWHQYYAWLQEQINQRMFDEVFGLKQVYVPLRAYYQDKENCSSREEIENRTEESQRIVVDLMAHLTDWVRNFKHDDCIRVVSGSPGSGKSSFSKMFAAHIAELGIIPVLFIPLHHFNLKADLTSAVNKFVERDRFLTGTPLDGKDGEKDLLLIFDGLDELSMQGKAAAESALAFVDEVISELKYSNNQGLRRIALLTGRDLAVQASSQRFRKSEQVLHVLPYFVEEDERSHYQDEQQLLVTDQRDDWWRNYGNAKGKNYAAMPEELKEENLLPITREPLLNYLVALSFERGKLDFSQQTTLNQVYSDLLDAVFNRQWDDSHKHKGTGELTKEQFFRILEEIALAIWHGDGRTATVAYIQKRLDSSGLNEQLKTFQEGAEKGVTRLLTAFYFRQSDKIQEGDKTFEFTHKSFGEYLTARRIVRTVKQIDKKLKQRKSDPDEGWNERETLKNWAEICGATLLDYYLFKFIQNELALYSLEELKDWGNNFIRLIESAVKHGMPMEKLGLSSFQQMMIHARNAEESLLDIHYGCARKAKITWVINWGSSDTCCEWLNYLRGQKHLAYLNLDDLYLSMLNLQSGVAEYCSFNESNLDRANLEETEITHCSFNKSNLNYASFWVANIKNVDFIDANLSRTDFSGARIGNSSFTDANLQGADFIDARIENVNFANANLARANFTNAIIKNANFAGANLEGVIGLNIEPATISEQDLQD